MNHKTNNVHIQDVTLRDGNQALRTPWNAEEKKQVFQLLQKLGVQGMEVGFPSANQSEFSICQSLASVATDQEVISALSRAKEKEIEITWRAIQNAPRPRLHIVYPVSEYSIRNVLNSSQKAVARVVRESIQFAKNLVGNKGEIQFSGEHFGDPETDLEFAIAIFKTAIQEGANVINLANTVERDRPFAFVEKVRAVKREIGETAILSIHTHNDLGMATATTVESVFAGATQVEVALNGLGERAGNTNLYETAIALHLAGKSVSLEFSEILPTAEALSRLTNIPIPEKAPILGSDIFAHRSGIHQDGVLKTSHLKKTAYSAFSPQFVGRKGEETIEFTNQSGKKALEHVLSKKGMVLKPEEIETIFRENKGVLSI